MSDRPKRYIDVSHPIEHGMRTYPGMPVPVISDHMTRVDSREHYSEGTEFYVGRIELVANTGTYVDSPFHRFEKGTDLCDLPLDSVADLEGIVIRYPLASGRAVNQECIASHNVRGKAVLIHTGWDTYWQDNHYFTGHSFLTKDAVDFLVREGARLVGIDSLNIDDTDDLTRPAHTHLLHANIPIVEHLCNLQNVPDSGFRFFAVPVKIRRFGSFPVRAFCIVD